MKKVIPSREDAGSLIMGGRFLVIFVREDNAMATLIGLRVAVIPGDNFVWKSFVTVEVGRVAKCHRFLFLFTRKLFRFRLDSQTS